MATNITYSQVLVGDLDVIPIYKELMEASTGQNSIYLRTKETLVDMLESSTFTGTEKSTIIAQTLSSIATGATAKILDAAIQIAADNRDAKFVLTKQREETKLITAQASKLEADIDKSEKEQDLLVMQGWSVQSQLYRDYGVATHSLTSNTKIIPELSYQDYGVKVETLKKAKVDTYATYANSYRTNGIVAYTPKDNGQFDTVTADAIGLTHAQTKVALRTEKGFDDNQRQHVANSSATMLGLLLSTEVAGLDAEYAALIPKWRLAIDYLNGVPSAQ